MNDNELIKKLEDFKDFLDVGGIFSDPFRSLGWIFVKGLSFVLDGLEKVTNDVLLVKTFFKNDEIVAFVETIRPFLYILLAFSLLYTGYMMIFQKKIEREAIAINIFIAIVIIGLLATGMEKANDFTDKAIKAVNTTELYDEGEGSLSSNILSRHINDLVEFDKDNFKSTEIEKNNTIPLSMIGSIKATEKFDSDELDLTQTGKAISEHYLIWSGTEKDIAEFDQGGLEWNNEYYYRYNINWFSLFVTLGVMAFTLFSIAYKLARLSFELTFNYILAILIAPADVHDGQKTKKVLQSILNTFLVIILIFISMKVYIIGTGYLADKVEGLAYLISLVAFSLALIDGPNMVERIFGIDAGLKSGWGVAMGALAIGKGVSSMSKGLGSAMNNLRKGGNGKALSPNGKDESSHGIGSGVASMNNGTSSTDDKKSPNDKDKKASNSMDKSNSKNSKNSQASQASQAYDDYSSENNNNKASTSNGISSQMEQMEHNNKKAKAPSPNDINKGEIGNQQSISNNSPNAQLKQTSSQGSSIQNIPHGNQQSIKDIAGGVGGLNDTNKQQQTQTSSQHAAIQMNSDAVQTIEEQQGNANVQQRNTGGATNKPQVVNSSSNNANTTESGSSSIANSGSTQQTRTSNVNGNSNTTVNDEVIVSGNEDIKKGNTNVQYVASNSGSSAGAVNLDKNVSNSGQSNQSGEHKTFTSSDTLLQTVSNVNKVVNEQTVTQDTNSNQKIRPEKYSTTPKNKSLVKH